MVVSILVSHTVAQEPPGCNHPGTGANTVSDGYVIITRNEHYLGCNRTTLMLFLLGSTTTIVLQWCLLYKYEIIAMRKQ